MAAVVPAINNAALQAVSDPQARQVLRSIVDGLAIRNGDLGSGDNAFITLSDLTQDERTRKALATSVAKSFTTVNEDGKPAFDLADQITDEVIKSPWFQSMFTRLSLIDAPDTVPGSMMYNLLQEARARGTALTEVREVIKTDKEAQIIVNQTMTTKIGDAVAAVKTETQARVDADSAIATDYKGLIATARKEIVAGYEDAIEVKTGSDNALAKAINTIWARVGNSESLVQTGTEIIANPIGSTATKFEQLQSTINNPDTGLVAKYAALRTDQGTTADAVKGLSGKWGVKIDLNGYVTGFSLNSGVTTGGKAESMFAVVADKFVIGQPGRNDKVPFIFDTTRDTFVLNGDMIATGSVTTRHLGAYSVGTGQLALKAVGGAQIDDLAVDTLKIRDNAVIVPQTVRLTGPDIVNGTVIETTLYLDNPGTILAVATISQASRDGNNNWEMWLYIDGVEVAMAGGASPLDSVALSGSLYVGAGWHRAYVTRRGQAATWATGRSLTVFGAKK